MKGHFQWKTELPIDAPAERVWDIVDDISLIPEYHPEVGRVDLMSGQTTRAVGVKYRCEILEGRKGSCVEEVVEHVPGQKMSVAFPEDTWGMSEMFRDFTVETRVLQKGDASSVLELEAHYDPVGAVNMILNTVLIRRKMKGRALETMKGIKYLAENP